MSDVTRFTLTWDELFGGYRVSVPNLLENGERIDVVEVTDALKGICDHYLMATAWAEHPHEIEPGMAVSERRAFCKAIVGEPK